MSTPRTSVPQFKCGVQYARHPSQPHLVAVCTLPKGHDGEHGSRLTKPTNPILRRRDDRP